MVANGINSYYDSKLTMATRKPIGRSLNSNLEHSAKCFAVYRKYARRPESKEMWTRRAFNPIITKALVNCKEGITLEGVGRGSSDFILETFGVGSGSGL